MKFTVLMSIYRMEQSSYLSDVFFSIYNSTLKPSEIILVEDGKLTDLLYETIDTWSAKLTIKRIALEKNVGLGNALNEGLKFCSSELIARMDTDDICLPDRFEKQIAYMSENPDIALLGCNVIEYDETMTTKLGKRIVPELHSQIVKRATSKNPFNHMSVVFRKNIIERVGGYKHHLYMEDYNLWLRVLASGEKTANLSGFYLHVRTGNNMIARRRGFKYVQSEYQLARLKFDLGLQNILSASFFFIVRSLPRLLPVSLLKIIYKKNRNS